MFYNIASCVAISLHPISFDPKNEILEIKLKLFSCSINLLNYNMTLWKRKIQQSFLNKPSKFRKIYSLSAAPVTVSVFNGKMSTTFLKKKTCF